MASRSVNREGFRFEVELSARRICIRLDMDVRVLAGAIALVVALCLLIP